MLSLFHLRPALRSNMAVLENRYRLDTRDDEPFTEIDRFLLRRFVIEMARKDLSGVHRVLH